MLITGGAVFVILVLSGGFIFIPADIALNVLICLANGAAIKVYKDKGAKSAAIASLFLLITEAAWIAIPIILLVPVALIVLAIYRVKAAHATPMRIAGSILAFVAAGLTIPFIFSLLGIDISEGFSFFTGGIIFEGLLINWSLFFVGRDVIPGILLLLGEGEGGAAASEPTYKTFIDATSKS